MPNVDQPRWLVVTILVSLLVGCTPSDSIPPAERTPETQDQAPGLIAFVSDREGAEALFVMHPDGSGVRRLTSELPAVSYPSWPADGQRIAFNAGSPTASDIYVINIDGSRPDAGGSWEFYTVLIATGATRSLTNSPGFDGQPAWQRTPQ